MEGANSAVATAAEAATTVEATASAMSTASLSKNWKRGPSQHDHGKCNPENSIVFEIHLSSAPFLLVCYLILHPAEALCWQQVYRFHSMRVSWTF